MPKKNKKDHLHHVILQMEYYAMQTVFFRTRESRVRQFLTRYDQVGVLSFTLRFQRLCQGGYKNSPSQEACIPIKEVRTPLVSVSVQISQYHALRRRNSD